MHKATGLGGSGDVLWELETLLLIQIYPLL